MRSVAEYQELLDVFVHAVTSRYQSVARRRAQTGRTDREGNATAIAAHSVVLRFGHSSDSFIARCRFHTNFRDRQVGDTVNAAPQVMISWWRRG